MMVERWRGLGLSEEVLQKVFHKNAERYGNPGKFPNTPGRGRQSCPDMTEGHVPAVLSA
jgi:hypothetical protein